MKKILYNKLRNCLPVYHLRVQERWRKALKRKKKYSNRAYIDYRFHKRFGRYPDLENPQTFAEKLQWMKLFYNDPLYARCADKFAARSYVEEKGLGEILNECYGVYTSEEQVDLGSLPDKFVIKATHGSGWNMLCTDKARFARNWNTCKKIMRSWLGQDYSMYARELHYTYIPPRLICERFIETEDGESLRDYKFYCFSGEPRMIQVDADRHKDHKRNFYDLNWNLLPVTDKPGKAAGTIEKPDFIERMLEISRILSEDFPQVRVDLYESKGKIYFGELTFTHSAGFSCFYPEEYNSIIGSWFTLPPADSPHVMEIY